MTFLKTHNLKYHFCDYVLNTPPALEKTHWKVRKSLPFVSGSCV